MKTALLISSLVSASQVGATASAFCLRRCGIDVVMLPTTLFGRHPGWGAPGGQAVEIATLNAMWTAVAAQNIHFDAVMSGYMAAHEHIDLVTTIIDKVRRDNPDALILVDPVKGDDGRLYIPERRANAMQNKLVPKADIITPNLYELEYIAGHPLRNITDIIASARRIEIDMLVTSVRHNGQIGALWVDKDSAFYVGHESFDGDLPNGGGDSLAALFLAALIQGAPPSIAQQKSVSSVFQILSYTKKYGHKELPLTGQQDRLLNPPLLDIQDISS